MEKFETLKDEILSRAKKADACSDGYCAAKNSKDHRELLEVIKKNFAWCWNATVETRESSNATYTLLDASLVRDLTKRKIMIKKSDYEILILE